MEYFGKKISFFELLKKIKHTAGRLVDMGITKGDIVSIQSLTMPETVILFYAIAYIGAIANFIYISSDVKNTKENLIETKSKLLFVLDGVFEDVECLISGTDVKQVICFGIDESADIFTKIFINFKKTKRSKNGLTWNKFISGKLGKVTLQY